MHTIQQNKGLVARLFVAMPSHFNGTGPVRALARAAVWLLEAVLVWQERSNQRHLLRSLPDAALKDIGISRLDAEREAGKPFWHA